MKIIKAQRKGIEYDVLVDDDDFEVLNKKRWHIGTEGYASRVVQVNGTRTHIGMTRLIMAAPKGMEVDHINHNRLDNRKANLRLCTHQQNVINIRKKVGSHSKYKGVRRTPGVKIKEGNKIWNVQIQVNKKKIFLGCFVNEEDALRVYNEASMKYFGQIPDINKL